MMFMSKGWDHVSELRPPTGLLSIPQVICEYGEPWRNYVVTEQPIRPPELSSNPTKSPNSNAEVTERRNGEICVTKYLFHTSKGTLTCRKISRLGTEGFTSPSKEGVLRIFIALKIQSPSAGIEPANLRSNSKHTNHCTTDDDWLRRLVAGL
jgi:hypothetical protein